MIVQLIQGFFFQDRQRLGLACMPGEGVVAVVRRGIESHMFAGALWQEDNPLQRWIGRTQDKFGVADLFGVNVGKSTLKFAKKYVERDDVIQYTFRRQGQLWIGEWSGDAVGEGTAQCILTEVPETIFAAPTLKS